MPKKIINIGEVLKDYIQKAEWGIGRRIADDLGKRHIGDISRRQDIGCNELVVFSKHLDKNLFEHFLTDIDVKELCGAKASQGQTNLLKIQLSSAENTAKLYRELAEARSREIELLRARVEELENKKNKL